MVKYTKFERLGWGGHIGRMDNATVGLMKKVMNGKFHGRRPVERPRLRWEENIRRDSSVLLNMKMKEVSRGQELLRRTGADAGFRTIEDEEEEGGEEGGRGGGGE
jgi:hypothetical protein